MVTGTFSDGEMVTVHIGDARFLVTGDVGDTSFLVTGHFGDARFLVTGDVGDTSFLVTGHFSDTNALVTGLVRDASFSVTWHTGDTSHQKECAMSEFIFSLGDFLVSVSHHTRQVGDSQCTAYRDHPPQN